MQSRTEIRQIDQPKRDTASIRVEQILFYWRETIKVHCSLQNRFRQAPTDCMIITQMKSTLRRVLAFTALKGKHQFLIACKIFHHGIEDSELHLILENYATMTVLHQKSSLTKQQAICMLLNSNFQKAVCVERKMLHPNSLLGVILDLFQLPNSA